MIDYESYCDILEYLPNQTEINSFNLNNESIYKNIKNFIYLRNLKNILINIDGELNSMVLLVIIKEISRDLNINIFCCFDEKDIHTNEDLNVKKDFIREWCVFHDISLEIIKNDSNYNEWVRLIKKYSSEGIFLSNCKNNYCINIFDNILRCKYSVLDIDVIPVDGYIYEIRIFNPLLEINENIYNFAKKFQIPFLLDLPPMNTYKYKIKDEIFPLCIKNYPNFKNNLFLLGKNIDLVNDTLEKFILEPIKKKIIFGEYGIIIPKLKELNDITILDKILKFTIYKLSKKKLKKKHLDLIFTYLNDNKELTILDNYKTFTFDLGILFIENQLLVNFSKIQGNIDYKNYLFYDHSFDDDINYNLLIHGKIFYNMSTNLSVNIQTNDKITPIIKDINIRKYLPKLYGTQINSKNQYIYLCVNKFMY